MSVEKKSNYLNIDFQTFLNCLKSIESELLFGLLHQETDYKFIDAVSLELMQLDSKIDSLKSWLDALFTEDKSKYERASLVLNNTINEIMEALGYDKNWQPETLDVDERINEDSPIWYILILKKINKRLNTKRSQLNIYDCIKCYIFKLHFIKEEIRDSNKSKKITSDSTNPMSFLKPQLISLFTIAEKKALHNKPTFSAIRCAAFCELLYTKKYFLNTNPKIKTLVTFASIRYQLDIRNSLASSKKENRKQHQENTINGAPPLKKCF